MSEKAQILKQKPNPSCLPQTRNDVNRKSFRWMKTQLVFSLLFGIFEETYWGALWGSCPVCLGRSGRRRRSRLLDPNPGSHAPAVGSPQSSDSLSSCARSAQSSKKINKTMKKIQSIERKIYHSIFMLIKNKLNQLPSQFKATTAILGNINTKKSLKI